MLEPGLEKIKQGDKSAFESFFRKHYNEVFQNAFFLVGQKEVASELGITKESVKTQIKIAFKKLREALN